MSERHFGPGLFEFLEDLARNNNRAWFDRHRERYVREVRDPVLGFVAAFAPRLRRLSRHLVADPRPVGGSMFRIHRDTRFSKDKSPYKTNAGAQFRHSQGKDVHCPGYYLHLGADGVFAAAGIWHPDGASLVRIREAIVRRPSAWKRCLATAGEARLRQGGGSLKRPPRGFPPDHPLADDLRRTDHYVSIGLARKDVLAPDFLDRFTSTCRDGLPFMRFLAKSLDIPI